MALLEHPEDKLPDDFVDELLTRKQAAEYLQSIGVPRTPGTLAKLHSMQINAPPCQQQGRTPLYPKRQLHEWGMRQLTQLRRSARKFDASLTGSPRS